MDRCLGQVDDANRTVRSIEAALSLHWRDPTRGEGCSGGCLRVPGHDAPRFLQRGGHA
jgi:hypothetical protein